MTATRTRKITWGVVVETMFKMSAETPGDYRPTPRALVLSAVRLTASLHANDVHPPTDVYRVPDGNIVLEWQLPGDVIYRVEIEAQGKGELMVTYPDRPAEFHNLNW